jgi:hypothetical protein
MVDVMIQSQLAEILGRLDSKDWERLENLLAEGKAGTMYGCLNLAPLGEEGARELMDAASDEMHHSKNIVTHRQWLHSRIEDALGEIRRAEREIKTLDELGDVEYEGGSADLEKLLELTALNLRSALALKPTDKDGN